MRTESAMAAGCTDCRRAPALHLGSDGKRRCTWCNGARAGYERRKAQARDRNLRERVARRMQVFTDEANEARL